MGGGIQPASMPRSPRITWAAFVPQIQHHAAVRAALLIPTGGIARSGFGSIGYLLHNDAEPARRATCPP